MKIYPVVDLMEGVVVRGVGGQRDLYRPVESVFASDASPLAVAEGVREAFGYDEFYLADLDALQGKAPQFEIFGALADRGYRLMVDAAITEAVRAFEVLDCGVETLVAPLESLRSPEELARLVGDVGGERLVFSLDLKDGQPLVQSGGWALDPQGIARQAVECGLRRLLILDLAAVGNRNGPASLAFCEWARENLAFDELITGGGVRSSADLHLIAASGVDGVLLATALHDGTMRAADLEEFSGSRLE